MNVETLELLVLVVHVVVAFALIGLVLIQHGKGAEAGASFGGGASQTVFGSSGSGSFLTRTTSVFAVVFFASSFALAVFAKNNARAAGDIGIPSPAAVESSAPQSADAEKDLIPSIDDDLDAADNAAGDSAGSKVQLQQSESGASAVDQSAAPESGETSESSQIDKKAD